MDVHVVSAHMTAATRQLLTNSQSPGLQRTTCFAQGAILFAVRGFASFPAFPEAAKSIPSAGVHETYRKLGDQKY